MINLIAVLSKFFGKRKVFACGAANEWYTAHVSWASRRTDGRRTVPLLCSASWRSMCGIAVLAVKNVRVIVFQIILLFLWGQHRDKSSRRRALVEC